jgi:hypothetical protein
MMKQIETLQKIELSCHNLTVSINTNLDILKTTLIYDEWESHAAIHFISRLNEKAKQQRLAIQRELNDAEEKRKIK